MDSPCHLIKLIKAGASLPCMQAYRLRDLISEVAGDTGTSQLLDKVQFVLCTHSIWALLNIAKLSCTNEHTTLCPQVWHSIYITSSLKKIAYGFKNFNIEGFNIAEL